MAPEYHGVGGGDGDVGGGDADGGRPGGAGTAEAELVSEDFPRFPVALVAGGVVSDDIKEGAGRDRLSRWSRLGEDCT